MSLSRDEIQKKFKKANVKKQDFHHEIPRNINEYLQFMDYKIRKQFKSFTLLSLCGGADRGNFTVEKYFQKAFLSMTLQQRINYYCLYIDCIQKAYDNIIKRKQISLQNLKTEKDSQQISNKNLSIPLKVGKGSKSFEETQIEIQEFIVKSKGKNSFNIDLRNYLLRKSKKKIDSCYVLQAIKYSDPETVRFAFLEGEDQSKYLPIIKDIINESIYLSILTQITELNKNRMGGNNEKQYKLKDVHHLDDPESQPPNSKRQKKLLNLEGNNLLMSRKHDLSKSVIQDIVKSRDEQQLDEQLTQLINQQNQYIEKVELQKKKSIGTPQFKTDKQHFRNLFRIILPMYSLKNIEMLNHYGSIYQSKIAPLYIYLNVLNHSQFKMQFTIDLPLEIVCRAVSNVQLFKYWHPQIDQGQIKIKISSENSCIVYEKTKAFSEWYKQRDYILLTHMFRMNNAYFIISKSVENANFIPFQSITRGKVLYFVWKVQRESKQAKHQCKVSAEIKVNYEGLLNRNHQKQLTLRYLKGFENMQTFYKNPQNQKKLLDLMGFEWCISDRDSYNHQQLQGMNSLRTCDFQDGSEIEEQKSDIYFSIQDLSEQQKDVLQQQQQEKSEHEISADKIAQNAMVNSQIFAQKSNAQKIETNKQGLIILPSKYLKKKHQMTPFDTEKKLMQFSYQSIVEKDDWIIEKEGGLKLINQVKIQAQNNVLKFIMKTLKKNIFSGKGILNISLPVEIFNVDSNLQRLCQTLCLGCQFLQGVAKKNDNLQRFKRVLALGLSCSIIYFDVQKPFNPILGETYQGFIRGCPIYAEQISHHPPISSIYFVGKGYKITANIEAKVHVHMNSGDGINEGFYRVIFDDGQQILFQTPPGQISGLALGDRRFNIKDKGLYIDAKNGYFCEMKMEAVGGLFNRKKRQFNDQIDGEILKVKPEFIRKFMEASMQKKPSPSQSDIIQKLGQLSGRWTLSLKIDGETYYDTRKNIPDMLIDDIYPLNSNSNYREDLYYRKKNDLSRNQIQKQRLEVFQRGDRKLRQKFHGTAH